jgi:CspA family cold shock protein
VVRPREASTVRGKVKWFDAQKGYGFIERDGQKDVFVHYSVIQEQGYKSLTDGEEVDYELAETDRGPQARNVRRLHPQEANASPAPAW